jgi:hypothetical protein
MPLIDEAALLHDQDSIEGGGEAGAVQAPNQAAASELLFQALKNGGFRLAVDYCSSVAESDNIGPLEDRCPYRQLLTLRLRKPRAPLPTG